MNSAQLESLKQSVRKTLSSGMAIAVIGWKDSNHSTLTRALPDNKFLFFEDPPNRLGQNVGFVLFTRFINHKDSSRFKDRKDCHAVVLGTGRIKEIFESCSDVLITANLDSSAVSELNVPEVAIISDTNSNQQGSNDLLDFLTEPSKEKPEMSDMEKFTRDFIDKAIAVDGVEVSVNSSKSVGNLITKFQIKRTPQQLVRDGWIEPLVREGTKKAHWYKAGRLMLGYEKKQEKPLPETTAGRVELLMSQEPELKEEKNKLEERLAEIERKLAMISSAKAMFDQLESEFAKK